jgi:hypothetical protein
LKQAIRDSNNSGPILNLQIVPSSIVEVFDYIERNKLTFTLLFDKRKFPDFRDKLCMGIREVIKNDIQYLSEPFDKLNGDIYEVATSYQMVGVLSFWVNNNFSYSSEYMANQLLELLRFQPTLIKLNRDY